MRATKTVRWPLALTIMVLLATSCTEITENFAGDCIPAELRCDKGNISICRDDGTGFESYKTCSPDKPCELNDKGVAECPGGGGNGTGTACQSNTECEEQLGALLQCQEAICDEGACTVRNREEGATCDDQSACTETDVCKTGICLGSPVDCNDDEQCTVDTCDTETGCINTNAEGSECDDNQPCTINDTCTDGACNGAGVDCNDNNPCTNDFCDIGTGECKHTPESGACDDGDPCTDQDKCESGICVGVAAYPCATDDDCKGVCGDVNPCIGAYYCASDNKCRTNPDTAFQCPDDGLGACEFAECFNNAGTAECKTLQLPDNEVCDDGSECTVDDKCLSGACVGSLDVSIPGCGFFKLKSWVLSAAQKTKSDTVTLRATISQPVMHSKDSNGKQTGGVTSSDKYKLRTWVIGL